MKTIIKSKQVDFVITQAAIYVDLEITTGISKILTLVKQKNIY